jgi:hypothetical protein
VKLEFVHPTSAELGDRLVQSVALAEVRLAPRLLTRQLGERPAWSKRGGYVLFTGAQIFFVRRDGSGLIRTARFTETASPIIVFTDHGLLGRYSLPGGGTVTVFAGYDRDSILPPEPEIFHGNFFDDQDVAAFCAALT